MVTRNIGSNPFAVQTPEDISAHDVAELFVDVFTDFNKIPAVGHTFLHGPRGSGKTMMFRYLEPDCQVSAQECGVGGLEFFGVYVPIKNTDLKLTELERLPKKHANFYINEHILTLFVTARLFMTLRDRVDWSVISAEATSRLHEFATVALSDLLRKAGARPEFAISTGIAAPVEIVRQVLATIDALRADVNTYLKRLSFQQSPVSYDGALCGYLDFFLPLTRELREVGCIPKSSPVFLLIDDADNLNTAQTQILNSWVFCRTSAEISLKVSTQLNYKTFRTPTGQRIETPHDYSEVNIATVYTSGKNKYAERVEEIVAKRLVKHGLRRTPTEYFPEYSQQEDEIRKIGQEYMDQWEKQGRGHRARDDAYRYARPDYIASLGGKRKASSTYRYAGFSQLVHISSGVIRYFLDAAAKMYAEEQSRGSSAAVEYIRPEIQDKVVREEAEKFAVAEFDKLNIDETGSATSVSDILQLRNLLYALGGWFRAILLSNASERRVFSVAFQDIPDESVLKIFELGVQHGYFHESTIGNKEGTGRARMFVLNRRLAPFFGLDPTGFSGYKFINNEGLRPALRRPKKFISDMKARLSGESEVPGQTELFVEESLDE